MAEAYQYNRTADKSTWLDFLERIFQLISKGSFGEIRLIFERLQREQCIFDLNSAIEGCTPLYTAANFNKLEMARFFIQYSLLQGRRGMLEHWENNRHPIIAAVIAGNRKMVELIVHNLNDINGNTNGPMSPLNMAIYIRSLQSVKQILAKGADINRRCYQGRSPLMESTIHSEICNNLIILGASLNLQDKEGFTVLHFAVSCKDMKSLTHLVNAGADLSIQSYDGISPLIWAVMKLNIPVINYLIDQPSYTELYRLESTEILNACFLCAGKTVLFRWKHTLQVRMERHLPKKPRLRPQEILDFSQEFTTETELENIKDDTLKLAYQSILVVERIIGRNNKLYMRLVLVTALIAQSLNKMEKVKQLVDHIQVYCNQL